MAEPRRPFLPAAGHDWLLPFYDPFTKLLGAERALKALVDRAAIRPQHRVLDVGCGTGNLALLARRLHPEAVVVGLDPDPKALARARRKAEREGLSLRLDRGFSDELPYPDASFDRVLSSFMFHHLQGREKEKTLHEIRRVLAPGGSLHLLDFAGQEPDGGGFLTRLLHSSEHLRENSASRILAAMTRAGFVDAKEIARESLLFFGRIAYYRASASLPGDSAAQSRVV